MKNPAVLLTILFALTFCGCSQSENKIENGKKITATQHKPWLPDDTIESKEEKRFYLLTQCLQKKFDAGKIEDAKDSISELKLLLPKYKTNWNYGNATHKINIIMGRIALQNGNISDAKMYLIEAGKTQGSPQLDSFGPNMSLAKELLEKDQKKVVLEYFDLCRIFWENDYGKLNTWTENLEDGKMPDFGANLIF
jgi:hypothetical protein